jgi:hypothetical protein
MVLGPRPGWTVVSPAVPEGQYSLNAVAGEAAGSAWAVGQTSEQPLIERWAGTRWEIVSSPRTTGTIGAGLLGVAAHGATAIAVGGAYDRYAGTEIPLIQYWNGLTWSTYETGTGFVLTDITMTSATSAPESSTATGAPSAWAVGHGFLRGGAVAGPVALRWDGGDWTRVPVPGPPRGRLLAVAASAPDDLWAVGGTGASTDGPLVVHFDGSGWRTITAPRAKGPLSSVVALGPRDVWAAGGAMVHHWTGRRWHRSDPGIASVNTLTALSSSDIWAAGGDGELAHFDGRRWRRISSPPPLAGTAVWLGSAAIAPGTVWMVGSMQDPQPQPPHPGSASVEQTGPRALPRT